MAAAEKLSDKSFLSLLVTATNPGKLVKARLEDEPWPLALLVSGSAFMLFFLQAGLDLLRANEATGTEVVVLTIVGLLYGTAGVFILGSVAFGLASFFDSQRSYTWTIKAFALGYAPTLLYVLLGLLANLILGWNTALVFGITGVMWALMPMRAVANEMVGGRKGVGLTLTTVCGALLLLSWSWL